LAGETGTDFFDPAGVTAGTIGLTDAILASLDAIAAGETGGSGDNAVALRLAALGEAAIAGLDGQTFSAFFGSFAGRLGVESQSAMNDEQAALVLVEHADTLRASVSSVSVDEEMVNLIAQQEAYQAAARLVGVADEMIQTLLSSY
jgi:flagellar hook-associated protein 1 FlgK